MGKLDISFENVREKTNELQTKIQNEFLGNIVSCYDNLNNAIEQSGGKSIDAIREELQQEKQVLLGVSNFMTGLLNFIQKSADAFEEVDVTHEGMLKY